jgi:hypothetical protein
MVHACGAPDAHLVVQCNIAARDSSCTGLRLILEIPYILEAPAHIPRLSVPLSGAYESRYAIRKMWLRV